MKNIWKKLCLALLLGLSSVSSFTFSKTAWKAEAGLTLGLAGDPINGNTTIQSYYESIGSAATGTSLLTQLQTLNSTKRKTTVGYSNMGKYYPQTDGDPNNSGNLICFYSGTSESFSGSFSGSINREHVWPNSRGGNLVEADIHMPRPTLVSENGSRGNSFYVEGQKSSSSGWDPAMESFGKEYYRGISARIIFYCVVASSSLSLVDTTTDQASNKTMGKLSDLLKWNLLYPVDATEIQRNDAAMNIQGNRNPFIDDRSLPCKIWGDYNDNTRDVCAKYTATAEPTSLTIESDSTTIGEGGTLTLSVTANPSGASNDVTWTSDNTAVASVNKSGVVTANGEGSAVITATSTLNTSVSASITITVKAISYISLSGTPKKTQYVVGEQFDGTGLSATAHYSDGTTGSLPIEEFYWLDANSGTFELALGTTSVVGYYGTKDVTYQGITVSESVATEGYQIVFKNNGSDATSDISSSPSSVKDYLDSGTEYVDSFSDMSKVFKGSNGIKFGSSSANGKMTVNLSEAGQGKAVSITVNAKQYNTDSASITVNGQSFSLTNEWKDYTVELAGTDILQAITIATTKRCYLQSITIQMVQEVTPPTPTFTHLTAEGTLAKTTYEEGETFDSTGLKVLAHYDDGTEKDVTTSVRWEPSMMTIETTSVTGTYQEGSIEKTITIDGITVTASTSPTVSSVQFSQNELYMKIGDQYETKVTILPETAENKAVTYQSSDESIVSVDAAGKLTAVKAGTATITVQSVQNSNATDTMTVNVQSSSSEEGTKIYQRVTADQTDWSGEYLIVNKTYAYAMNGALTAVDATKNYIAVTDTNMTIESNATTDASTFTITAMSDGYSIQAKSGKYIGQASNANGLTSSDTALKNTISFQTSDSSILIKSAGGAYLRFNAATDQLRFRYYKSSSYTAQQAIYLYKLVETGSSQTEELRLLIQDVTNANTCEDYQQATDYRTRYLALKEEEQAIFDATVIEDQGGTVTLKDKLAFMEQLLAKENKSTVSLSPIEKLHQNQEGLFLLVIGCTTIVAFAFYSFIYRKRFKKQER